MNKKARGKVINLKEAIVGRANAEELQKTMASPEALARHHPAHARAGYPSHPYSRRVGRRVWVANS